MHKLYFFLRGAESCAKVGGQAQNVFWFAKSWLAVAFLAFTPLLPIFPLTKCAFIGSKGSRAFKFPFISHFSSHCVLSLKDSFERRSFWFIDILVYFSFIGKSERRNRNGQILWPVVIASQPMQPIWSNTAIMGWVVCLKKRRKKLTTSI